MLRGNSKTVPNEPRSGVDAILCSVARWTARLLVAVCVAMLLSYLPYRIVANGTDRKLEEMSAQLQLVNSEISAKRELIRKRRTQVHALKTDTQAIEDIARENLQMLYPHEKTLHFSVSGSPRTGSRTKQERKTP